MHLYFLDYNCFFWYIKTMAIKIVKGYKLNDVAESVISQINPSFNFKEENIIVVPDRFSLVAEKMVFDVLNIRSTFNIKVMGINGLARKLIQDANLECVFCDNFESKFILYRTLQKVKNNFVCFSKNLSQGFCDKIMNALSLIRSSDVAYDMLNFENENLDENTKRKMQDLKLVYEEYEKLLNSRLDATNVLKLFGTLIESASAYKNTNFYFCGFDSFTKQGYEIIEKIAKICNNLVLGVIVPSKNSNAVVFDNEMYERLKSIFKSFSNVEEIDCTKTLKNAQPIFENVFGYNIKKYENFDYAKVYELSSMHDEITFMAKEILRLTKTQNCKYKNISVATSNAYFLDIENVFDEYGISYYIDNAFPVFNTTLSNFIKYAFDLAIQGYAKECVINLINNEFFNVEKDEKNTIENAIIENNLEYKKLEKWVKENNCEKIANIFDYINEIKTVATIEEYCEKIDILFKKFNIFEKLNEICDNFKNNSELLNEKTYIQVFDKITNLNEKLKNTIGTEVISLTDFYDLYFNALKDLTISQVPIGLDCVYVGDTSSSFFEKVDYLFVLGANQDNLPTVIKDLGLISDNDINDFNYKFTLSPTVKMINRRNKFKLFDLLTLANKRLYVTYALQNVDGAKQIPSSFVLDILKVGAEKITQSEIYDIFADDDLSTKILFNNPTLNSALNNITVSNNSKVSAIVKSALIKLNCYNNFEPTNKDKITSGKCMVAKNSTKISQIESYYNCPFSHFLKYGIKLKERKNGKFKANDFGNFLHEFAKKFFDFNKSKIGNLTNEEIEKCSAKIYDLLIENKKYQILLDDDNDMVRQILLNEVIRFAKFVNFEQSCSEFKITNAELAFGRNKEDFCVFVDNEKYSIVGVIDRVDKYQDWLRIIDYKTGSLSKENAKLQNLFYGLKIQVYVYLKVAIKMFNGKAFGAFYLPISNSFTKDGEFEYKLNGYFLNDVSLASMADKNLNLTNPKSSFFEAQFSTSATNIEQNNKVFVRSKNISQEQLEGMMNYSIKIVKQGLKEIIDGNTLVSPIDGACEFCEFKSICGKEVNDITERQMDLRIEPNSFLESENEWVWKNRRTGKCA